ncbi:unnamed protein product, partial [Rotaria sp. Silwood1]
HQDMNKKQHKEKRKGITTSFGQCPLTFDGAYGLTKAKYSIEFCQHRKKPSNRIISPFHGKA